MEPILQAWSSLDKNLKIIAASMLAVSVALVALFYLLRPSEAYQLLYSDVDLQSSGAIIAELDSQNIPYQAKGTGIYVPASQVAAVRMSLAASGLPKNTLPGYELLDGLSGFGTTSRMYNVAYIRALEGELARTISSNDDIKSARVHIAVDQRSSFLKTTPPTASAVLFAQSGRSISTERATAIQHLIAAAVANLTPENVEVLDHMGTLLTQKSTASSEGTVLEQNIREKLIRLLEARVGQGNAVVEVSIRQNPIQEVVRERIIDPDSRVAISQEIEESSNERQNSNSLVGVASNLPETASPSANGLDSESRMRETVSYEISQKEREMVSAAGRVERISVAVLINETSLAMNENGRGGGLQKLTELVTSAAGVDTERGDIVTVESMPFSVTAPMMPPEDTALVSTNAQSPALSPYLILAALGAVILGAVAYARTQRRAPLADTETTDMAPNSNDVTVEPIVPLIDPEQRLRALIGEHEDRSVMLLKSWLEEGEKA